VALAPAAAPAAKAPPAPVQPRTYSFLHGYTDQLAVPGYAVSTDVTPQFDLYTGWTELSARLGPNGPSLKSPDRTLEGGRLPIVQSTLVYRRLVYQGTVFEAAVGNHPANFLRVDIANPGDKPATAELSLSVRYNAKVSVQRGTNRYYQPFRFGRPS